MNDTIMAIAHSMAVEGHQTIGVTETSPTGQVIRYSSFAEFWYAEKLRERERLMAQIKEMVA